MEWREGTATLSLSLHVLQLFILLLVFFFCYSKVTTSDALNDHENVRLPTLKSWRLTQLAIVIIFLGAALTTIGIQELWMVAFVAGGIGESAP